MKPAAALRGQTHAIGPGFRGLVRRTCLLNLGMIVSVLALGMFLKPDGANGLVLLSLLLVSSALLWTVTFAISSVVWICQVFWRGPVLDPKLHRSRLPGARGVSDRWLDEM
jgi:hypothetical protein